MNTTLRHLLRHYLHVVALCCAVAVLTTMMWPQRTYLSQLVYALCIGTVCWSVIELGRLAVPQHHCHASHDGGPGWPKGWRGLLLTALGIVAGFYGGDWLAGLLVGPGDPGRTTTWRDSMVGLYITIAAGVIGTFYFYTRGQAASLAGKIATAERDAREAQLKLLEAQLEPHMLFNTLANLRVLISLDPPRATRMLDHLVAFLRATLQASRAAEHTLTDEFARLQDYLELMAVRMGPRLRFTLDLPAELGGQPIPALLLQPLVENAIQHGLEPKISGGTVVVRARQEADMLCLEVVDNGVGLAHDDQRPGTGFGLQQVHARLATRYGEQASLQTRPAPGGGVQALLRVPATTPGA